jgi:hypothetical protein
MAFQLTEAYLRTAMVLFAGESAILSRISYPIDSRRSSLALESMRNKLAHSYNDKSECEVRAEVEFSNKNRAEKVATELSVTSRRSVRADNHENRP